MQSKQILNKQKNQPATTRKKAPENKNMITMKYSAEDAGEGEKEKT